MTPMFSEAELHRLLGRGVRVGVGEAQRAAFAGRRVLITGAGGSIGSELAREIAACGPASLGLLDHSELGLFSVEREIRARWPHVPVVTSLVDVTHRASVSRVCRELRPEVVYHAAAYKHVTMAERAPAAAARVNVIGTWEVATAAAAIGARFVLISSDKAADPKSVMGATKRLAELVTIALASATFRPVVVRFGNVLGSSGSVLQIMREQVRAGRPIPLTDPDATRYFMTATEAVGLVMRADLLGGTAEILWLDMGDPVRMGDLAARLIALETEAGYAPVPIEIVGLRPGEKRTETLSDRHLVFKRTLDDQIRVARDSRLSPEVLSRIIPALRRAVARADDSAALDVLTSALAGFAPSAQARAAGTRAMIAAPDPVRQSRRRRAAA